VGERSYLSIGDVLSLLREEFPDITISKIRFLESRGLLVPERTPSGYRKFYEHDVDRLRWILRQQRENFLPLKVIKGRLEGNEPSSEQAPMFEVATGPDAPAPLEPLSTSHQRNGSQGHFGETPAEAGTVVARSSTAAVKVERVSSAGAPGGGGLTSRTGRQTEPGKAAVATIATPRRPDSDVAEPAGVASLMQPRQPSGSRPTPDRHPAVEADGFSGGTGGAAGAEEARDTGAAAGAEQAGAAGSAGGGPRLAGTRSETAVRSGAPPAADPASAAASPSSSSSSSRRAEPKGDSASPVRASLTAAELAQASNLDVAQISELESFGLIESRMVVGVKCYDDDALAVCGLASAFARFGVEARHLRIFKHAAERQASLYSQIVMPLLRQRNPDARRRAQDDLSRLTELGASIQACFAKAVLRDLTKG
jgi:DNA-binding transcriptional MerR regulator